MTTSLVKWKSTVYAKISHTQWPPVIHSPSQPDFQPNKATEKEESHTLEQRPAYDFKCFSMLSKNQKIVLKVGRLQRLCLQWPCSIRQIRDVAGRAIWLRWHQMASCRIQTTASSRSGAACLTVRQMLHVVVGYIILLRERGQGSNHLSLATCCLWQCSQRTCGAHENSFIHLVLVVACTDRNSVLLYPCCSFGQFYSLSSSKGNWSQKFC